MYLDSCKKHEVPPNSAVLSWFSKAKIQNSIHAKCSIVISLDQLKDADISSLIDVFMATDSSEIDAVDILHESHCVLSKENVTTLMNAVDQKLRIVDFLDISLGKDVLWDICQYGLACEVLNLRSLHIEKLDMVGVFMRLHTLNLDFCTSLSGLQKDCFSCMPYLIRLSMCETRVANLWTTAAALSKLRSLVELRFQNCLCCKDTGPCPALSGDKARIHIPERTPLNMGHYSEVPSTDTGDAACHVLCTKETGRNLLCLDDSKINCEIQSMTNHFSEKSEVKLSSYLKEMCLLEVSATLPDLNGQAKVESEIQDNGEFARSFQKQHLTNGTMTTTYDSYHPSPICFEKNYRDYIISSLPRLEVLDNVPIRQVDRELAKSVSSKYYEHLPYRRRHKESVVHVLGNREMRTSGIYFQKPFKPKLLYPYRNGQHFFLRSLSAAKLGSSAWPLLHSVSNFSHILKEESKRLRPRQFEYNPSNSSLMAFGTLDGEVVVINHESGKLVSYIPSTGAMNSVLGLCWLKKHPSKLVAGSDNGSLRLFDINHMPPKVTDTCCRSATVNFDDFEQLTSLHVNSTDDQFLASGYTKNVALYDICSGKRLQLFTDMHREPINVAKFAHHSPFLFATSSFDRDVKMWDLRQNPVRPCYTASSSRGNVMLCFSPDDLYLLVSAVDNEVKQILAADGRLCINFEIASSGSAHNYTRSYYINGRDYVISGSCDEHVVRICCAQTGRRLRDVHLEDNDSGKSMFVQSLRGDPFREFHMSVLAASRRTSSKWEIIKVNLLASSHCAEESSSKQRCGPCYGFGG
ncbi:hypothetical protein I3842_01G008100 [Carya illinoinensis]|uniref:DWD hypersensitive to UV-B 1 N-terminal domain-containing protein n=1 Tax=Carya illinoinensis TaxID=32201 RepID=A0A922K2Q3_CARIL|nr:hypothetical protein I3842_01G008100 [Carya illinoinensis]